MPRHAWQREDTNPMGKGRRVCRVTNNHRGVIRSYGLMVSRRTFRELAKDIGFKKLD